MSGRKESKVRRILEEIPWTFEAGVGASEIAEATGYSSQSIAMLIRYRLYGVEVESARATGHMVLSQVFPDLPVPQRVLLEEGIRQGEMLNHCKAGGGEAEAAGYMAGEVGLMSWGCSRVGD